MKVIKSKYFPMIIPKEAFILMMKKVNHYLKILMEGLQQVDKKEVFRLLRLYLKKYLECTVIKILVEIPNHYLTGHHVTKEIIKK